MRSMALCFEKPVFVFVTIFLPLSVVLGCPVLHNFIALTVVFNCHVVVFLSHHAFGFNVRNKTECLIKWNRGSPFMGNNNMFVF